MPFVDLSQGIPLAARWIKIRYTMRARRPGEPLVARLWSGDPARAVQIRGSYGDAFVKLEVPQTLSYEKPDGIDLSLKAVAYKLTDEE